MNKSQVGNVPWAGGGWAEVGRLLETGLELWEVLSAGPPTSGPGKYGGAQALLMPLLILPSGSRWGQE